MSPISSKSESSSSRNGVLAFPFVCFVYLLVFDGAIVGSVESVEAALEDVRETGL